MREKMSSLIQRHNLIFVSLSVTRTLEPRPIRTRPGRQSWIARASAVPAGGLATRARAALGIKPLGTMTGVHGAFWTSGQAGAGNAAQRDAQNVSPPRPRKPGPRLSPL